jgi:hypothetical protein
MEELSQKLVQATTDSNDSAPSIRAENMVQLKRDNERLMQENNRLQLQSKQDQMKIQSLEQQLRQVSSRQASQQELGNLNSSDEKVQLIASLQAELSIVKGL